MISSQLLRKQRMIVIILIMLLLGTFILALGLGYSSLSYNRILPTLLGYGNFKEEFVLFSVRMPRIIVTILAGMALSLSGAILQAITRNDLADPGIIGINAGAGVGVSLYFLFFPISATTFVYMLPFMGFLGALITAGLILLFSYQKTTGIQPVRLILVGIGFAMALSGLMIILISSAERSKVDFIAKWIAGNIWGSDWKFILAMLPWLLLLIPYTFYKAKTLNLLAMSEQSSIGLGVSVNKERLILLLTSVALASSAVSVTGGIAFVGLIAPHMAKALVGPRHQLYLPIAILIGGWLLMVADTIGRNVLEPGGIPAGIMISLIGAPYFIYLLLKK
ncbi:FecCD family ABC transporter permease [Bacillus sp. 2205SS5-2]|uniref:FecCD family ABC transporter permease n=1 Tax=Bacillus sp. 2205SS5-2 TaxID=3109031 RepID=UPI0030049FED